MTNLGAFPQQVNYDNQPGMPFIMNPPERPLEIYARPEIRTGCIWEIQLRISQQMRETHSLRHIYLEKPRASSARCPYLCLTVRSKLKVPVEELALTKVAKIENDSDYLTLNEFSTITLKVRFTTRPRVVFQKQSDMMILIVSLKRADQILCSDEAELIFRGGTGSIHSADSRKANNKEMQAQQQHAPLIPPHIPHLGGDHMNHQPHYAPLPYEMPIQSYGSVPPPEVIPTGHGHKQCMNSSFQSTDNAWSEFGSEFESTNYLGEPTIFGGPEVWSQQNQNQQKPPTTTTTYNQDQQSRQKFLELLQNLERPIEEMNPQDLNFLISQSEFTIVHNKKRGFCSDCMSECLSYRGCGGPCGECGCFPSAHIDLDRPMDYNRKRLNAGASTQPSKKPRTF
jgi:hypothetical protein